MNKSDESNTAGDSDEESSVGNSDQVTTLFLDEELARLRNSLRRTRAAGSIIVAVVLAYMSFVTVSFRNFLEPKSAAELTTTLITEQVQNRTDAVARQIKQRVPALIAGLPAFALRKIPEYREQLEERIETDIRMHCQSVTIRLTEKLDEFISTHEASIKTILAKPDELTLDQALKEDFTREVSDFLSSFGDSDESIKEKLDNSYVMLQEISKQTSHLATNQNLSPEERKTRFAFAVIAGSASEQVHHLQMVVKAAIAREQDN